MYFSVGWGLSKDVHAAQEAASFHQISLFSRHQPHFHPLRKVCSKLVIDPDTSFYLNLGNDRPNITMSIQQINGLDDYEAL